MRKTLPVFLLVAVLSGPAFGDAGTDSFPFITWNPGAALSLFPTGFVFRSILPVVLFNLEAGVALAGGYWWDNQALEGRAAIGNSNATYLVVQAEAGWSWFFAEAAGWLQKGPYAGGSLRYWDLIQIHSFVQSHNIAPMLHIGWWFDFGSLFVDLRMSQVFAVASFSSIPGSLPGFQFLFSPLPGISPWMPIGLVQLGIKL
jgi:hypothetical protein